MRISKDPEVRKQEILENAIELFCQKGYEKTSISDIAKKMDISQGLCYRYFPSKENMFDVALEQYADFLIRSTMKEKKDNQNKSLKERLSSIPKSMGGYTAAEKGMPAMYQMFHQEGSRKIHDQLYLKIAEKSVPYVIEELQSAIDKGEIHISDPETVAMLFTYGQYGILMRRDLTEQEKAAKIRTSVIELLHLT